jgi:hypothetical protein
MESDPLMPLLQSENPNLETENFAGRLPAVLKELRGKSFMVGWAVAALLATAGWLYFIARIAYYLFNWVLL